MKCYLTMVDYKPHQLAPTGHKYHTGVLCSGHRPMLVIVWKGSRCGSGGVIASQQSFVIHTCH